MAAFNRPTQATYEIHENIVANTQDNEDHTFCGIMFPIRCKDLLPLDHLIVKSVAVRGRLGPMTVWVSNESMHHRGSGQGSRQRLSLNPKHWTKLYERTHGPSLRTYQELVLDTPIRLEPGDVRVIYIHSTLPGDEAIVYDNSSYDQSSKRYEDDKLAILTGRAHRSNQVFGLETIWGWGDPWKSRREFVGRLSYGTVYKLWNPHVHRRFGGKFTNGVESLLLCQRRWESPLSMLPDECIYYILNMCRWDWFDDNTATMVQRRQREKAKLLEATSTRKQAPVAAAAQAVSAAGMGDTSGATGTAVVGIEDTEGDQKLAASCPLRCCSLGDGSGDQEQEDEEMDSDDEDDEDGDVNAEENGEGDDVENEEEDEEGQDPDEWSDDGDDVPVQTVADMVWEFTLDSDDNDSQEASDRNHMRQEDYRRQIQRILIIRALASLEGAEVVDLGF